ncbi:MAG: hypothetical protein CFE43_02690 [Burkholderiales bacterium PBB3]|nr:MAG: hypothetical protein CFE43_02690 [Burkholderiales bacterium PBB3]
MTSSVSVWLVVFLAVAGAMLPFISQRLLGVLALSKPKTLGIRLLELVACYFLVGGIALLLEKNAGQIAPQGWEFYAITGTMFITLAFPGFVYRYLLKHPR